jgi:hypothetical protein
MDDGTAHRDLPLRDFASGTILCPNHDPPRQFAIPNNARYRRLAHEIDALLARPSRQPIKDERSLDGEVSSL